MKKSRWHHDRAKIEYWKKWWKQYVEHFHKICQSHLRDSQPLHHVHVYRALPRPGPGGGLTVARLPRTTNFALRASTKLQRVALLPEQMFHFAPFALDNELSCRGQVWQVINWVGEGGCRYMPKKCLGWSNHLVSSPMVMPTRTPCRAFPRKKNRARDFWKMRCQCCERVMHEACTPNTRGSRGEHGHAPWNFRELKSWNGSFWQNPELISNDECLGPSAALG